VLTSATRRLGLLFAYRPAAADGPQNRFRQTLLLMKIEGVRENNRDGSTLTG
jgi:hypothetical protein